MNIGIIGCGWIIKKVYIPILISNSKVRLKLFDSDPIKLFELKDELEGVEIFETLNGLLSSGIDAVIIASPNFTHTYYTDLMLDAGIHILCEKPVSLSVKEYTNSVNTAISRNLVFMPAYANRYREDIIKLRELIKIYSKERLIKIKSAWVRNQGVPNPRSWRTDKRYAGGGVLADLGPHIFDICLIDTPINGIEKININTMGSNYKNGSAGWYKYKDDSALASLDVETFISGDILFDNNMNLEFEFDWNKNTKGDYVKFSFQYQKTEIALYTLFGFSDKRINDFSEITTRDNGGIIEKIKFNNHVSRVFENFKHQIELFIYLIENNKSDYIDYSKNLLNVRLIEEVYRKRRLNE